MHQRDLSHFAPIQRIDTDSTGRFCNLKPEAVSRPLACCKVTPRHARCEVEEVGQRVEWVRRTMLPRVSQVLTRDRERVK